MFEVGDKVRVVQSGQLYRTYKNFIKKHAPNLMNKWESGRYLPDDGIYKVKATGTGVLGDDIAIIEQNNKVYIVAINGLELVTNQFTKSDLKDNHIVVQRSGYKGLWKEYCNNDFTNNLKVENTSHNDIMEVYEFDKLVWKREEQILDEVEKNT